MARWRIVLVGRMNGRIEVHALKVPHLHAHEYADASLSLVEACQAHISSVTGFSPSPESPRSDPDVRTFCSVGADNDIVVFSLVYRPTSSDVPFTLECLFRLSGHHSGVRSIYWDTPASALHARCDKTFVWSLLSGSLERRTGNTLDFSFRQASRHSTSTGAVLFAHTPTSLVAATFEGDVDPLSKTSRARRLQIDDEGEGASMACRGQEFAWNVPPPCGRFASLLECDVLELGEAMRMCFEKGHGERCGQLYGGALSLLHEWGLDPALDDACRTKFGMREMPSRTRVRYFYTQRFPSGAQVMLVAANRWKTSELLSASQNLGMVTLFLTATTFQSVPMTMSETLSQLVTAYGIKYPDALRQKGEWKEPSLMFLARQALSNESRDEMSSGGHVAARLLLQRTVERMPAAQRTVLVVEWSTRLARLRDGFQTQVMQMIAASQAGGTPPGISAPLSASSPHVPRSLSQPGAMLAAHAAKGGSVGVSLTPQGNKRVSTTELSALESDSFVVEEEIPMDERLRNLIVASREYQLLILLLSVVGVVHPEDISPVSARLVTETLVELLSVRENGRSMASASGLAAAASSVGAAHSSSGSVLSGPANFIQHQLRNLQSGRGGAPAAAPSVASPAATSFDVSINPAFAAELLAKGFPLFRPHIPHMSRLIKKLLLLASDAEDVPQRATAADRALSEVGAAHPVLFVKTVGSEVCKKDASDAYRRKALEVLINLVKAFPVIFLRHLPLVAEVVIKMLDPSEPGLRNSCLSASTLALQELVKRYPMVSFHQNSQRFAVGTVESTIIIYDLRTATKWRVLDGTEGPVSAVAFEKEGERMASYCAQEHAVRIWATRSPGLFGGLLTIRGTFLCSIQLPALKDAQGELAILKECRLEWISPGEVKLRRESGGQPVVLVINQ